MMRPKNRLQLINLLVEAKGYRSYLEIGCGNDATFSRVRAERKVGVDPKRGGTHRMTSDEFFEQYRASERFDVVLIDGLHYAGQVIRDVNGSLACLNDGGTIVIHDCLPRSLATATRKRRTAAWNGDVWKAMIDIRQWPDVDSVTYRADEGIGLVVNRPNTNRLMMGCPITWHRFQRDRAGLMRIVGWDGAIEFLGL